MRCNIAWAAGWAIAFAKENNYNLVSKCTILFQPLPLVSATWRHRPQSKGKTDSLQLEEAATYKSAKHGGTAYCVSWFRPLTSWPQIKGFPGLMIEHFYVNFGDPSCRGFWDIMREKDRPTDRQTDRQTGRQTDKRTWKPYPATTHNVCCNFTWIGDSEKRLGNR